MNDDQTEQILSQIKTKDEANRFIAEIDQLLNSYFRVGESKREEILTSKISYPSAQLFKTIIAKLAGDHAQFEKFLSDLKAEIQSLPVCSITIAFDPSESTLNLISQWVRNNISTHAILDVLSDSSIIGGAKIALGGKYKDMSIKSRLEDLFADEKNVLDMLKSS